MVNLLTVGDPSGIGPEIVLKSFIAKPAWFSQLVVLAPPGILEECALRVPLSKKQKIIALDTYNCRQSDNNTGSINRLYYFPVSSEPFSAKAQNFKPTVQSAKVVMQQFQLITEIFNAGQLGTLITGPIHKKSLEMAGFAFKGHTDFLADLCQCPSRMILAHKKLRVMVQTHHMPLNSVAASMKSSEIAHSITLFEGFLARLLKKTNPEIAILGLNPHAGEEGLLGSEEKTTLTPLIAKMRVAGHQVSGPFPADSFFCSYENYDGVLAMYHDQGLIPVKMLSKLACVNITLGLPFFRISVGHGTAHDIASAFCASAGSLLNALEMALLSCFISSKK